MCILTEDATAAPATDVMPLIIDAMLLSAEVNSSIGDITMAIIPNQLPRTNHGASTRPSPAHGGKGKEGEGGGGRGGGADFAMPILVR